MNLSVEEIKDKNWCYEQYVIQKKSVKQLRRETGLGINTIKRWFKYHGIDIIERPDLQSHQKENHPKWKGQKRNNGYNYVYFPEHPNAGKAGYISEHRMISSNMIKRPLTRQDIIHHIDGNRLNNEKNNLFLTTKSGHKKTHASLMRIGYSLFLRGKITFKKGEYRECKL